MFWTYKEQKLRRLNNRVWARTKEEADIVDATGHLKKMLYKKEHDVACDIFRACTAGRKYSDRWTQTGRHSRSTCGRRRRQNMGTAALSTHIIMEKYTDNILVDEYAKEEYIVL